MKRGIDPYNVMSFVLEGCDDILRWDSVVNVTHDYFVEILCRESAGPPACSYQGSCTEQRSLPNLGP